MEKIFLSKVKILNAKGKYWWLCAQSLQSCSTLQHYGLQPARLLCPWNFPGKNTGVGCHALLQGIFLTQGSSLCFLNCREILFITEPPGKLHKLKPASDTKHGKFLRQISSEEGHYLQHMIHELIFLYIKRTENQSGKDKYPNRKLSSQTIRSAGEGREGWSKRTQKDVFPP